MYCTKCGSKVKESWKVCPNCGKRLQGSPMVDGVEKKNVNQVTESQVSQTRETTNINVDSAVAKMKDEKEDFPAWEKESKNAEIFEPSTDFEIGQTKFTGRMLIQILSILLIVCFFCPLYVVSHAGQELVMLNGLSLTFGFDFQGESIKGNLFFGILLLLPICGLACTYVTLKDSWNVQKYKNYGIAISSCAHVLFAICFTYGFQSAVRELGLNMEIMPCIVLRLMWVLGIASTAVGGYLTYLAGKGEGVAASPIPILVKCIGIILGASVVITVLFSFLSNLRGKDVLDGFLRQDVTWEGENLENYDVDEEGVNQASNETRDENDEIGSTEETEKEEIEQISKDTKGLTGTYKDLESGMSLVIIQVEDKISYGLYEKDGSSFQIENDCGLEDGYINGKYYAITRNMNGTLGVSSGVGGVWGNFEKVDDKAEIVGLEYVIGDSDKKYLTQDDVRGLTLQEINYAKNEIYARHGRRFQSAELQNYFDSKSWYKGLYEPEDFDQNYSGRMLNDFEKKNAEFLRDVEFSMDPAGYQLDK